MEKSIHYIRPLILAIFLMSLADAVFTASGVSLGVISEGNPIVRDAMHGNPAWTAATASVYTGALLALLYKIGSRCRFIMPLLIGLFMVKAAVIVLHLSWILMI